MRRYNKIIGRKGKTDKEAIKSILKAEKEPRLKGDLDKLITKHSDI